MYHLGPGPLGGNLLNLYEYRKKPSAHRRAGYAFFRFLYQMTKGLSQLKTFGGFNKWLTLDEESEGARTFETVIAIIDNYAYAYRMGTVKSAVDVLEDVLGTSYKGLGVRLVTDISHNILAPETYDGERYWVSRHNCCKPHRGLPGIMAGSNRAISCLTYGLDTCEDFVCGYDHGIGKLLQNADANGQLTEDSRKLKSTKIKMFRGTEEVIKRESFSLYDTEMNDKVAEKMSQAGIASKAAYLRPLMTLKMTY